MTAAAPFARPLRPHDAERRSHARAEQLGVLGHELRAPLSVTRGALQLLGSRLPNLPPREQQLLDMASRNTDRLLARVTALIDLEAIEAGVAPLEVAPCSAGALVRAARERLLPLAHASGVRVDVTTEGDDEGQDDAPRVRADLARAEQVCAHLLTHAVVASPAGSSVQATVRTVGDEVHLVVRDAGAAVPTAELPRLFDRFVRVRAAGDAAAEATGLELALVRAIARRHGGRAWAEPSATGIGVEVGVALPAA